MKINDVAEYAGVSLATVSRVINGKKVKKETKEMLTALEEQLNEQQWSTAAQFCDKLRFLKKLADEITQVEERLFEL